MCEIELSISVSINQTGGNQQVINLHSTLLGSDYTGDDTAYRDLVSHHTAS